MNSQKKKACNFAGRGFGLPPQQHLLGSSIVFLVPANTNDLFVDVEYLQKYRKLSPLHEHFYGGLVFGFGKNVFVFDVKACDFHKEVKHEITKKEPSFRKNWAQERR